MDILYQNEEFCMEFSAEELETELIDKLKSDFNVDIQIDYEGPNNSIDYISIEPEKDNLAIRFYGFETALYVFDEKIMLVDDNQLEKYAFSHTYGNVIYNGKLRILTHAEILSLLLNANSFASGFSISLVPDNMYMFFSLSVGPKIGFTK